MSDEAKIVIVLKENRATIGVSAPGCDPVFDTAEGDLSEIFVRAEGTLECARELWNASPRYPKSDMPKPAPAPTPAPTRARSTTGTAAAPKMF